MEIEEDYNQAKRDLLRSIIDTGDDYPEFYNSSEDSSISSISSSSNDMNVDKPSENNEEVKEQNIVLYDRQEENDRKNFINMFKNKNSYPNANSIADSNILSWHRSKIYNVYQYYSLHREFPEDRRKSKSPSKMLKEYHIDFLEEEIEANSDLKNSAMVKLIKDKYGIEISDSTVRRALHERGYSYIGPKISPKNTLKEQQKRLDWCKRHLNKYWHKVFFTDETTVYFDNPSGLKWVKSDVNYTEHKRKGRGQKLNLWGAISANGKVSLQIFEENLNTEKYTEILSNSLDELREISKSDWIVLQMDNCRVHWSLEALQFYKDNEITVIDWPPYSPDLNPIENLWGFIKAKLGSKKYLKSQLSSKIISIWEALSDDQIKNYCTSIYDRIGEWIENNGKMTSY